MLRCNDILWKIKEKSIMTENVMASLGSLDSADYRQPVTT